MYAYIYTCILLCFIPNPPVHLQPPFPRHLYTLRNCICMYTYISEKRVDTVAARPTNTHNSHTMQDTVIHSITRQHTATHCNVLQYTAAGLILAPQDLGTYKRVMHCTTLHRTAQHDTTLQHTATHCNTLQRTAAHYSTLHHTASHCNTGEHIHCANTPSLACVHVCVNLCNSELCKHMHNSEFVFTSSCMHVTNESCV